MSANRASALAPWLAAAAALLLTAWMFLPGFMSFDSAYQWHMVRSGEWVDVHSPFMNMVWSLTERVVPGPGGMLLLHLLLFWSGLAVLANALFVRAWQRVLLVLAVGFWPALLAVLPFIWKDVGLLVAMVWVAAFLATEVRRPSRALRLAALLALTVACAYRHNALPLALPLLWYVADRELPGARVLHRLILAAAMLLAVAVLSQLPARLPNVEHRDVWSATTLWDVAAVSTAKGQMLLPPELIAADLDLAELETLFVAHSNTTIYSSGKIKEGVSSRYTQADSDAARAAWWRLWRTDPVALLRHRLRLSGLLFGLDPGALPDEMTFAPTRVAYLDNPPVAEREPGLQRLWSQATRALVDTPVFALWGYAILAALTLAVAVCRGWADRHPLLVPVLLSALLYVLPLVLVAPSAEFRYLVWPVLASLLGVALALARPGRARTEAPAAG